MKQKLILLTILLVTGACAKAQNLIAVQHAGTPTFYAKLPDVITNAMAGDTVYIPGGSFDKPSHLKAKDAWLGGALGLAKAPC